MWKLYLSRALVYTNMCISSSCIIQYFINVYNLHFNFPYLCLNIILQTFSLLFYLNSFHTYSLTLLQMMHTVFENNVIKERLLILGMSPFATKLSIILKNTPFFIELYPGVFKVVFIKLAVWWWGFILYHVYLNRCDVRPPVGFACKNKITYILLSRVKNRSPLKFHLVI